MTARTPPTAAQPAPAVAMRHRMPWHAAPRPIRWHERFSAALFACLVVIALAAIAASDAWWWLLP